VRSAESRRDSAVSTSFDYREDGGHWEAGLLACDEEPVNFAVVAAKTFPAPILIERAGPSTRKKLFEFFAVLIRNAHTRAAYHRRFNSSWPGSSAPDIKTSKTVFRCNTEGQTNIIRSGQVDELLHQLGAARPCMTSIYFLRK
jgi:hypothetical protein